MEQQRRRSQSAHETIDLTCRVPRPAGRRPNSTVFLGYTRSSSQAQIDALLVDGKLEEATAGTEVQIVWIKHRSMQNQEGRLEIAAT